VLQEGPLDEFADRTGIIGGAGVVRLFPLTLQELTHIRERELDRRTGDDFLPLEDPVLPVESAKQVVTTGEVL
jgi:hypothetical protein